MIGARAAAVLAAVLSALACDGRPDPARVAPPLDIALHEVQEVALTGRPVTLLDTARGLAVVTVETDLERISISSDDGMSWSELTVRPRGARIWITHQGCPDLHAAEFSDEGLFHVRGHEADAPRSRVAESGTIWLRGVAAGPGGRLAVAWVDQNRGWQELMFSQSTDHGVSWSPAVRVNTESRRKEIAQSLVLRHGQGWAVIWTENRDPRTLFDLYGSYCRDGRRFGAIRRLNDDEQPSFSVEPAAVEDERGVHVLAQDYRELNPFGDRDANIYYARMAVDSAHAVAGRRVNDVADAPQAAPAIARDGGNLVAVWLDSRHRLTRDVYASASRDGGQSWSPNRRINAGGLQEVVDRPLIASRRAGGVYVLWTQTYGPETRMWLRRVTPGEAPEVPPREEPAHARIEGPLIDPLLPPHLVGRERFDGDSLGSFEPISGSWIVHDGALLSFGNAPVFAAWTGPPLGDLVLEGRFRLDHREHLGAHLFLRMRAVPGEPGTFEGYQLRNHFRMGVLLSRARVTIDAEHPPSVVSEPIADRWFPLLQDNWYEFRVVVAGRRIDYWLDNQWMLSHQELEPGAGRIMLGGDILAPVEWDDLAVYSLASSQEASSQ